MFCTNCGIKFEGNFCPACGTPAGGATVAPSIQEPDLSPEEKEEQLASDWPQGLTEEGMYALYEAYRKDWEGFACDLSINLGISKEHSIAIVKKYMAQTPLPSGWGRLHKDKFPTNFPRHRMVFAEERAHFRGEKSQKEIAREQREAQRARIEENKRNGIPMCPKCNSTALQADSGKKFSLSKAVLGDTLLGAGGIAMGINGGNKKKIDVVCLNCGHRWTLKSK